MSVDVEHQHECSWRILSIEYCSQHESTTTFVPYYWTNKNGYRDGEHRHRVNFSQDITSMPISYIDGLLKSMATMHIGQ